MAAKHLGSARSCISVFPLSLCLHSGCNGCDLYGGHAAFLLFLLPLRLCGFAPLRGIRSRADLNAKTPSRKDAEGEKGTDRNIHLPPPVRRRTPPRLRPRYDVLRRNARARRSASENARELPGTQSVHCAFPRGAWERGVTHGEREYRFCGLRRLRSLNRRLSLRRRFSGCNAKVSRRRGAERT